MDTLEQRVNGLVAAEIEKRRGGGAPDSGMDVNAWNATPEGRSHPKDARGRWTDNPVGQAIGQAYSNVRARHSESRNPWIGLADLREELGDAFTREEVDTELKRLGRGSGDPNVLIVPEGNQKTLTDRDRTAALLFGGESSHLLSMQADDLPAPRQASKPKASGGNDLAAARRSFAGLEGMDPFSPERMQERELAERKQFAEILQARSKNLGDWSDEDLASAQIAARDLNRAIEMELFRRKGDALNPPKATKKPATARLTNKQPKDLKSVADRLRAAKSREEANEALVGLTIADLRELTQNEFGHKPSGRTKAEIQATVVQILTGGRLASRSLFPSSMENKPAKGEGPELADRINEITSQLGHVTDPNERKALLDERRRLGAEAMGKKPATARLTNKPKPAVPVDFADMTRAEKLKRPDITRAEIEEALKDLKLAELKALAKTLREQFATISTSGTRKDQIRDNILEGLVGFRERSSALSGLENRWGGNG